MMTTPQIMVKGRTKLDMANITHDGNLIISVAKNRKAKVWKSEQITWSALVSRLSETKRTEESQAAFFSMAKSQQDEIKDVGGFVGGTLQDGIRSANTVISRQILALDVDNASKTFWDEFICQFNYTAVVYSTHKHTDSHPRCRLLAPLSRPVDSEEYEAIGRKFGENFGLEHFDPTTFQASRLMYWPSTSYDATFFCASQDGEWLDVDAMLNSYRDWHDRSEWAYSTEEAQQLKQAVSRAQKVEDPLKKHGWIAAFCRAYTIQDAISQYLADVYEPVEGKDDRYTYIEGSSTGGAVVYENKWLYSNHATDPVSQRLCNAFDLVRLHLYGDLDKKTTITDPIKLPSYKKMVEEICSQDDAVKEKLAEANYRDKMGNSANIPEDADLSWVAELETNPKTGVYLATRHNYYLIMEHDERLKGLIAEDAFSQRICVTRQPSWRSEFHDSPNWDDNDDCQLRFFMETNYGLDNTGKLNDIIKKTAEDHSYHAIQQYLKGLTWDGKPRMERLFITYLGAPDNEYVRTITYKMLLAAVWRVFDYGCKWDNMVVLFGDQGQGKSKLIRVLGKEKWSNDSLTTFEGKEAMELLRGFWIFEIAELAAMNKSETDAAKQFISKESDAYREAYGYHVKDFKRQCIFIGTTNKKHFLTDATGNRRFFPIDVDMSKAIKSPFDANIDDEIDQVWAEAYYYFTQGQGLELSPEFLEMARVEQEKHEEHRPLVGIIEGYLNTDVPENWYSLVTSDRISFLNDEKGDFGPIPLGDHPFKRNRICLAEIFVELQGGSLDRFELRKSRELADAMRKLRKTWKEAGEMDFGKPYGRQIAFVRVDSPEDPDYKQGTLFDAFNDVTTTPSSEQEIISNNSSKPVQDVQKTASVSASAQKIEVKPAQNAVAKPSTEEKQPTKADMPAKKQSTPIVEQKKAPAPTESAPAPAPVSKKEPPATPQTKTSTSAPSQDTPLSPPPKAQNANRRGRPPKKSRKEMTQKERFLDILNSTDGADKKGMPEDDG